MQAAQGTRSVKEQSLDPEQFTGPGDQSKDCGCHWEVEIETTICLNVGEGSTAKCG